MHMTGAKGTVFAGAKGTVLAATKNSAMAKEKSTVFSQTKSYNKKTKVTAPHSQKVATKKKLGLYK